MQRVSLCLRRYEKDVRNRQVGFTVGYNTRAYESVRVGYEFGSNFDADFQLWTAVAKYKPRAAKGRTLVRAR